MQKADTFVEAARGPLETGTTLTTKVAQTSIAPTAVPFDHSALQKRVMPDNRRANRLGNCVLRTAMTFQSYPLVSDYSTFPAASSYFPISRDGVDAAAGGTCTAAIIYSTDNLVSLPPLPTCTSQSFQLRFFHQVGASASSGGPSYATQFRNRNEPTPTPWVNSDHVFELSLLGSFFGYALNLPGAPSCADFNTYFVDNGLLQQIYDVCVLQSSAVSCLADA